MNLVESAGSGEAFNVGQFLEESSPYAWAGTGIGLCIGLSVLGAGWYVLLPFSFECVYSCFQGYLYNWLVYPWRGSESSANKHQESHQVFAFVHCSQLPCRLKGFF
jgi:hypothetical protein